MTMQIYLSVLSQFVFSAAVTIFLMSILVIIAFYCFKMAEGMISKREKVIARVKKSFAKPEIHAVPKKAQAR